MKSSMKSKQKSKKSTRDKEKRKSQNNNTAKAENVTPQPENSIPQLESNLQKYAGLGKDSVFNYAEQTLDDHVSGEVCAGLAEDLSYKLRLIIHESVVKARLTCRNSLRGSNIEANLKNLQVDNIYGASNKSSFVPFTDQNLFYLDDSVINLIQISEEVSSFVQPGAIKLTKKCLQTGTTASVDENLRKYYEKVCALVSTNGKNLKRMLQDVSTNKFLGPIVNWFYRFCLLQLNRRITSGQPLNKNVLLLLQALEMNPLAKQMVSEQEILIVFKLIYNLLVSQLDPPLFEEHLRSLRMLCARNSLQKLVIGKLRELHCKNTALVVSIAVAISPEVVARTVPDVLLMYLVSIEEIVSVSTESTPNMKLTMRNEVVKNLLLAFNIIYENNIKHKLNNELHCVLGQAMVPLYKPKKSTIKQEKQELLIEHNKLSFKTRRKLATNKSTSSFNMDNLFEEPFVVIGKRSNFFAFKKSGLNLKNQCLDHSLLSVLI